MTLKQNPFKTATLTLGEKSLTYMPLDQFTGVSALPYCVRIMLESAARNCDELSLPREKVEKLAAWTKIPGDHGAIAFTPARVLLQDLTGVPLVVDLAALRSEAARQGKDPAAINPLLPVDLVIDHSIQVDFAGTPLAFTQNTNLEYRRNHERYEFLKWAQASIRNFRVIPPASGIVHQVNLEYLAGVVSTSQNEGMDWIYPDSVFGTDSHTTMVNGLGVLGWGVGGIEAAAVMLGQPVESIIPDVVGVNVTGALHEGVSPTDVVLTLTYRLRELGVVNKMVEFFGASLDELSVPDRAMLSNMAPEYGATAAYFPVDDAVLDYLRLTGRQQEHIHLVEAYYKAQGLFRAANSAIPGYTQTLSLDLSAIEPSLAGPKRPQDLVSLDRVSQEFSHALAAPVEKRGYGLAEKNIAATVNLRLGDSDFELSHGSVVLAAITSCTNTSNPFALISAGLLAKKAVALGLRSAPWVKTSLAPGSKAVMDYLQKAGLVEPLETLGFHLVGYGCTTCIGNSGPLDPLVSAAIQENHLVTASVISGNRNFEGRVHPLVQANYLSSPALVVAYAILGSVGKNLHDEPLGYSQDGAPILLRDVWPTNREVLKLLNEVVTPEVYRKTYANLSEGDAAWRAIDARPSLLYPWNPASTYIVEPPFCAEPDERDPLREARVLAIFGDSITTDHISPAGAIPPSSPAGDYLRALGIEHADFNSYGARRGNHEVMMRGTFANIRIKNAMLPGVEGPFTRHSPSGDQLTLFEASRRYREKGMDLVVLAGKEYGSGSSRDWAAKGPLLLGVKAVIAESFERIHRSNLAGMGILPLQFLPKDNPRALGLDGSEVLTFAGLENLTPGGKVQVTATKSDGVTIRFWVNVLLTSDTEVGLWRRGGILRSFLKQ
jgi:aconitate hydratase